MATAFFLSVPCYVHGADNLGEGLPTDEELAGPLPSLDEEVVSQPVMAFVVTSASLVTKDGSKAIPIRPDVLYVRLYPGQITIEREGLGMEFEAVTPTMPVVDESDPARRLMESARGFRLTRGGSVEQVVVTGKTLTLFTPGNTAPTMMITYAEAIPNTQRQISRLDAERVQ